LIGGAYRGTVGREYVRCHNLDKFKGVVIGCNSAYKVRALDVLVFIDHTTYKNYSQEIRGLNALKFYINPKDDISNEYIHSIKAVKYKLDCARSFQDEFTPDNLTGPIALNIAVLLGCNPICLSGFTRAKFLDRSKSMVYINNFAKSIKTNIYNTDKDFLIKDLFDYRDLDEVLCYH
jgi:hypothetical protein